MAYANLKKLISENLKLFTTGPKNWVIFHSSITFLNTIGANFLARKDTTVGDTS